MLSGGSGSLAEFAAAKVETIAHMPSIDYVKSAALPLAGVSAVQALIEHVGLKKGDKILIHGGAGGIGSIAIQIAKHIGAHVATTVGSDDLKFAKKLGADEVIDYKKQKFEEIIKDYDAVFDTVGGETYKNSFKVLKKGGIIVSMLEQPNEELMKKHDVKAVSQFTQVTNIRLTKLAELVNNDAIKVIVDKTFPLDETADALDYLRNGHPVGKVVVEMKK